jgi:hypothetical protein
MQLTYDIIFTLGPFKYYISKEVGGVRKWQFLLIYSTIYADVGG